jgi:amino acid transporter
MAARPPFNPFKALKTFFFGKALDLKNRDAFHNISLIAFFAWVGLGADGLSSASYGPEEAFKALGHHPHLGLLVALGSMLTVLIISASYSHLIELFPAGGGGYLVASKLLGPKWGMVSGCALLIDYVLTISISVASGADAIFSFVPREWIAYKIPLIFTALLVLILMNLRGVKESVIPLVPIFLIFIATHAFAVVYGITWHLFDFPELVSNTVHEVKATHTELGLLGMLILLARSYSMGAGTYTGIEAVSNGMPILREPRVQTGKRTMAYMAFSLAFMVLGLMVCYVLMEVHHVPGKTMNAVLFESLTAHWPAGWGNTFVWVTLFSEAAILFVAAQAGFLGGPRVLANMAVDHWAPTRFTLLSDRLVTQNGVVLMGVAAGLVMLLTGASVQYLVVLYSITVFITFVLSQAGLVKYWWAHRERVAHWKRRFITSVVALTLCGFILITMTMIKFFEGGWITLLILGALITLALVVRQHYEKVGKIIKRLDTLVNAMRMSTGGASLGRIMGDGSEGGEGSEGKAPKFDPKARTAVLLVSGFNGLGLHTLLSIIRLFGGIYRNFIFVEVALIDAGNFKGAEEVDNLKKHVDGELAEYVQLIEKHGYYGEAISVVSHDVVEGSAEVAPKLREKFPQAVFFMGQLVFPEESFVSRLFYNNAVFAVQRRLYHVGIPFIIMPVRVKMRV